MINSEEIEHRDGAQGKPDQHRATAWFHCADGSDDTCEATTVSNIASPPPASGDKKGSGRRCLYQMASGRFLLDYKALKGIPAGRGRGRIGVPIVSTVSTDTGEGSSDSKNVSKLVRRSSSLWRDASDELQGHFAHEAIASLGPVVAFTAWCNDEIDAKARASGKPLGYIRKRLHDGLQAVLKRPPAFVLCIEEEFDVIRQKFRFHVHGEIQVDRTQRKSVREALRAACGPWEGTARCRQIRMRRNPDAGWISYCTKRTWLATPGIRQIMKGYKPSRNYCLSFEGPVLTMTNTVRTVAKDCHEQAQKLLRPATRVAPLHTARPRFVSSPKFRTFVSFEIGKSSILRAAAKIPTRCNRVRLNTSHQAKDIFSQGPPSAN